MERPEVKAEFVREIHEHEVLLSFNGDDDAVAFHEWWELMGFKAFEKWAAKNPPIKP